jgi:2-polyprenyl-3-methyl-5-hydroxy-6-metoxy-1,4-benzoquinol methylase
MADKIAEITPRALAARAWHLYRGGRLGGRAIQALRPYICPFDELLDLVPAGARVLDVGCGAGLFLALLADTGRLGEGYGFDMSGQALKLAGTMVNNLNGKVAVKIEHRDATEGWPKGSFDAVSLIDVMHHVPPDHQAGLIETAASRLVPGGLLLYKDMAARPRWRGWSNRLHDLIIARQWINYAPMALVHRWATQAGLEPVVLGARNTIWYGHEWTVYRLKST